MQTEKRNSKVAIQLPEEADTLDFNQILSRLRQYHRQHPHFLASIEDYQIGETSIHNPISERIEELQLKLLKDTVRLIILSANFKEFYFNVVQDIETGYSYQTLQPHRPEEFQTLANQKNKPLPEPGQKIIFLAQVNNPLLYLSGINTIIKELLYYADSF